MSRTARTAIQVALSLLAVAGVTALYSWLSVNPTTVSLTYLLTVVVVATTCGIGVATMTSVVAMLAFNIFFLPPFGTITIADPQNWVTFFAFMAVAVVCSQLAGRARERHLEAVGRQQDLERLYALSRSVLLATDAHAVSIELSVHLCDTFGFHTVGFHDRIADRVTWGGHTDLAAEERLREVARTGEVLRDGPRTIFTPIRLGGAPIGSMMIGGDLPRDAVLQSIANLAAIALERARSQAAVAETEAARQTSELRSALLDAVAHEFKTPLTASKAAVSALLGSVPESSPDRELVEIVGEELTRLQALVTDAIHMLRLDAGEIVVHQDRHGLAALVEQALREMGSRLAGHRISVRVAHDIVFDGDASLLRLALRQLLDNAAKYSPARSSIDIAASSDATVRLSVTNSGPPISPADRARIFERFYRGDRAAKLPGSGLGLAIVRRIARAHGGDVSVTSEATSGTTFTIALPAPALDPASAALSAGVSA